MMIPTIADAIPAKVVAAAAAAEKTSLLIDGRVAGRASARQGCGKVWLSEVDDCCYMDVVPPPFALDPTIINIF